MSSFAAALHARARVTKAVNAALPRFSCAGAVSALPPQEHLERAGRWPDLALTPMRRLRRSSNGSDAANAEAAA